MISDDLFKKLNKTITKSTYPKDKIVMVPDKRIKGRAFFPGGDGLYMSKTIPKGGIMILGQDFDNQFKFKKSRRIGGEKNNPTWINLIKILDRNEIPTSMCFFTNAIMGLRKGNDKSTGRSKAFNKKNGEFLTKCRMFFLEQVEDQKPKLIIGLGKYIPKFLSETHIDLYYLSKIERLKHLGNKIKENIKEVSFDNHSTKIIFITHPSIYTNKNVDSRLDEDGIKEFGSGKRFEYELIKEAYRTITC